MPMTKLTPLRDIKGKRDRHFAVYTPPSQALTRVIFIDVSVENREFLTAVDLLMKPVRLYDVADEGTTGIALTIKEAAMLRDRIDASLQGTIYADPWKIP